MNLILEVCAQGEIFRPGPVQKFYRPGLYFSTVYGLAQSTQFLQKAQIVLNHQYSTIKILFLNIYTFLCKILKCGIFQIFISPSHEILIYSLRQIYTNGETLKKQYTMK